MSARPGVCAIGGVMAVLKAQTLGFAGVAGAATIGPDAQGWWSEAQQAPQQLPVDTVTGPNLEVGGDPTGPNAIAAVRFIVPGTIDDVPVDPASVSATLTLKVAPNTAVGTPAVVACPVLGTWQPASAGMWSTRPLYNCDRSAAGTLSDDKASMAFKLDPSLQAHGTYDVALVPAPANQAPFSVQFVPAGAESLALGSGPPVATPGGTEATEPSTDTPLPGTPDTNAGSVPLGGSSFDVGSPLPLGATPAVSPGARASTPAANSLLPAPFRRVVSTSRSQQAIALGMLGVIVMALWWFGGEQARAPRLLGSLGDGVDVDNPHLYVRTGGIGRFARPRTKPPPRL
jgi:hypothetical protein